MPLGDPELDELLAKAKAAYDALTPEEKWKHCREQAISWVYGQLKLSGRDVTRDAVERSVDRMIAQGELKYSMDGTKPVGPTVWQLIMSEDFP